MSGARADVVASNVTKPPLPKWRSHKVVEADRIEEFRPEYDEDRHVGWWIHLEGGNTVYAEKGIFARGEPRPGDYFVRYDDGYASWSPCAAFEAGYTRLEA